MEVILIVRHAVNDIDLRTESDFNSCQNSNPMLDNIY